MSKSLLNEFFPTIQIKEKILKYIYSNQELSKTFSSWPSEFQEEFLAFCTGIKGIKVLYDSIFKELFNPETHRERVEHFLSQLLGQKVKIKEVLPNDTTRLSDESALLITDIVVELEDGPLANLEVQKIGYAFPGQRLACYSADLLLRQYKRVKDKRKKKFTYRDIQKVYTIVIYEKSPREFHLACENYIHHSKQQFDTALQLEQLQENILIALDIFQKTIQNKPIETELEAWLTFLSCDQPERIIQLLEQFPFFKEIYQEIYDICQNIEEVMRMFSKELYELDKNTVQYMIDELEEQVEAYKKENMEYKETCLSLTQRIKELEAQLSQYKNFSQSETSQQPTENKS